MIKNIRHDNFARNDQFCYYYAEVKFFLFYSRSRLSVRYSETIIGSIFLK